MSGWGEWRKSKKARRLHDRRRWFGRMLHRAAESYPHPRVSSTNIRTWDDVRRERLRYARLYYRTRTRCSDFCCGNPRRHMNAMTPQESRFADDAREQCEAVGLTHKPSRFSVHS